MDPTTVLAQARLALEEATRRTANLVRSLPALTVPIPGSEWAVREAAAHLVNSAGLHRDIAEGTPSPVDSLDREVVAAVNADRLADIPEDDPEKMAGLLTEAVAGFLESTAWRSGHEGVVFHGGLPVDLAALTCISLGEQVLHGYDMAVAARAPWPIDAHDAELVLYGYRTYLGGVVDPKAAGTITATYGIEFPGGGSFTASLIGGRYHVEAVASEIDCTISADPAAFLLVASGRMSHWTAIALRTLQAGGPRPELAASFMNLFAYP